MHTQTQSRSALWLLFGALVVALFAGCLSDSMGGVSEGATGLGGTAGASGAGGAGGVSNTSGAAGSDQEPTGDAGATVVLGKCLPASAEPLPQRSSILSVKVPPSEREVQVSEIFNLISSQCKGCHVEQNLGNFQLKAVGYTDTLEAKITEVLRRLQSDDLSIAMPAPATIPYSKRPAGDSVRVLVQLLTEWSAAGYPRDVFSEKLPKDPTQSPYALSTELGLAFSNLGTCIPSADFPYASDRVTMAALDKAFAARARATADDAPPEDKIGLPKDLTDTDLTSFDSAELARTGLVAFVPTYPLWSDDAGKLRYVRVPLGQSIRFDAKTQRFDIPDNTRFYKTFMKKVTDLNGSVRWRKLETRLIVARHDTLNPSDKNYTPQSLFGSYEWDETETHATLLTSLLRNGDPFADHLFEYEEDEPRAAKIRASMPSNLTYALDFNKVARHWAVPGSQRCVHCHEGSENDNFIIGFTPLQINSRKVGEGGVYEGGSKDQLGQFQRLIDLGVITGVGSLSEVVKLEDTQQDSLGKPKLPRNDHELKAQGYLLGNCAHCHNPNGFPSVAAAELKDTITGLNFYPGKRPAEASTGGIFQFPLEKFSQRITHGYDNSKIPYITPSLRDIEPPPNTVTDHVAKFSSPTEGDVDSAVGTVFKSVPWRSLIYRNVQTPFTYSDAATLYPHMPFDTGGFDCRAPQWLGEWMVSIPAQRKHPELSENATTDLQDIEPQPYTEVLPGEDGYDVALAAARRRLSTYQSDPQYSKCPDNSDLVDPDVVSGRFPSPHDYDGDGIPDRGNWVVTDLTERKGLWVPRRTDWKDVLVSHQFPKEANDLDGSKLAAQQAVVAQLDSIHLADVDDFAGKPFSKAKFPLGLWQNKPACQFNAPVRRVNDPAFTGSDRPQWFDKAKPPPAPDAPVFEVTPGQAIFDMICINCHGPNADSLGRQADTLQNLTGGSARVANFRFGLFNPTPQDDPYDKPDLGLQLNRERVFGPLATSSISADDWGARYLAWMALGGTGVQIPPVILKQVGRTGVAGLPRTQSINIDSANMLQVAQYACSQVRAQIDFSPDLTAERRAGYLLNDNGDAELWARICHMNNSHYVMLAHVTELSSTPGQIQHVVFGAPYPVEPCQPGVSSNCYPLDAPVGNQRGGVDPNGLQPDNTLPWCLTHSLASTAITPDTLTAFATEHALPFCPPELGTQSSDAINAANKQWETRGAINAGLLVFQYLDARLKNDEPHIGYDQCELLPQ
jgi:mono/diheme cytochrome c family protein